jgi:hypothetical protein
MNIHNNHDSKINNDLKNNPDYHIEQFWLQFKSSMNNFYHEYKNQIKKRNLDYWSSVLNNLQKNKSYCEIERLIRDYIICYGIDVMRCASGYHIRLLGTNIKRWDKLSSNYNFLENSNNEDKSNENNEDKNDFCSKNCMYKNINRRLFQSCIDICISLQKSDIDLTDLINDADLIVIQSNITPLIEIANRTEKISIFDILIKNVKQLLIQELKRKYGNDIFNGIDIRTIRGKTIGKILWESK